MSDSPRGGVRAGPRGRGRVGDVLADHAADGGGGQRPRVGAPGGGGGGGGGPKQEVNSDLLFSRPRKVVIQGLVYPFLFSSFRQIAMFGHLGILDALPKTI